jgi:hypothetical protein
MKQMGILDELRETERFAHRAEAVLAATRMLDSWPAQAAGALPGRSDNRL